MNGILVVGSVALDSVKTPEGETHEALGGSAVYFSLAARHFAPVRVVGVVGEDFPDKHRKMLMDRGVDVSGMQVLPGKTFRWAGRFGKDYDRARTLSTELNVFEKFDPQLSDEQRACPVVFLANIDPDLQRNVLSQMAGPRLVACDTMNYWIGSKKPAIKKLLSRVDILIVNEEEARKLTRESSNVRAARCLSEWGPAVVVVKKGEHGSLLFAHGRIYPFPAYPIEFVKDPTGAGDSFAGGFVGYISTALDKWSHVEHLKRALAYGTVMASFNVSDFSTRLLDSLTRQALDERARLYWDMLSVPSGVL